MTSTLCKSLRTLISKREFLTGAHRTFLGRASPPLLFPSPDFHIYPRVEPIQSAAKRRSLQKDLQFAFYSLQSCAWQLRGGKKRSSTSCPASPRRTATPLPTRKSPADWAS